MFASSMMALLFKRFRFVWIELAVAIFLLTLYLFSERKQLENTNGDKK